jgi:hypothetical protein
VQPPNKISQQRAVTCALTNQFATPGLGSLMAGRFLAGSGQLLLAVGGFVMVVAWVGLTMHESYNLMYSDAPPKSFAWLGVAGGVLFGISWFWALVTSIRLVRQAKADEEAGRANLPPRITNTPKEM